MQRKEKWEYVYKMETIHCAFNRIQLLHLHLLRGWFHARRLFAKRTAEHMAPSGRQKVTRKNHRATGVANVVLATEVFATRSVAAVRTNRDTINVWSITCDIS